MRSFCSLILIASWALAAPSGQPTGRVDNPNDLPEVINYTVTMERVDKWAAANHGLLPYHVAHLDQIKNKPDPPASLPHTMEAMARWTKTVYPEQVRIVERAGMPFKEYLIMSFALSSAMNIESAMDRGIQIPADVHVNQANVAFVKANKAKLAAMFAEYQQLMVGHK
jgi:hypothetical protein